LVDNLPTVSVVIPTYNEEKNIGTCLDSILYQDYPPELIEIIVVDNRSEDRTVEIIRRYIKNHKNIKLTFNDIEKHGETSKMIGLHYSKNKLFLYLDADIEMAGKSFLKKLIKPLIENPDVIGSFPRFVPKKSHPPLARYLRYHPLELDPVFQFFCTEINQTIIKDKGEYKICKFIPPRIPPIGICIYRRKILFDCIGHMKRFMDIDVPVILSKRDYNKFAFVPGCGIYHNSSFSIKEIVKKRKRNINRIYLPNIEKRKFTYFNLNRRNDRIEIIYWILYSNMFLPMLFQSMFNSIKNKDTSFFYQPFLAMFLTDLIIFEFIRNKIGRRMFLKFMG